jgi:hypothetical protein
MQTKDILRDVADILASAKIDLRDPAKFKENLRFVYHLIKASGPLLNLAGQLSWGRLKDYYREHALEEQDHDIWLRHDLVHAGVEIGTCPSIAAQLAGSIYYHLQHTSTLALLGYMLVLEGFPTPIWLIEELEAIHGKDLLRTSRYHAEHDIDHGAKLFAMIESVPEDGKVIIHKIATESAAQLAVMFLAIEGTNHG